MRVGLVTAIAVYTPNYIQVALYAATERDFLTFLRGDADEDQFNLRTDVELSIENKFAITANYIADIVAEFLFFFFRSILSRRPFFIPLAALRRARSLVRRVRESGMIILPPPL